MVRRLIIIIAILSLAGPMSGQRQAGTALAADWKEVHTLTRHQEIYWKRLQQKGFGQAFARAIVAPELLRFSQLRNKLEGIALQVMYIHFGKDYADFSIGPFQVKPSFAERVEKDLGNRYRHLFPGGREGRVNRLKSTGGQFLYLEAFLMLMERKYGARKWPSEKEKLRFYATAYNCGYWFTESYIRKMMGRSHYKTNELSTASYNYADIALEYYLYALKKETHDTAYSDDLAGTGSNLRVRNGQHPALQGNPY